MRIGVQTNPAHPITSEIERAATDSFDYVDIMLAAPGAALEQTDWRKIADTVGALNLSVHCQAAAYLPIANPSPLVRQAALDEMRRSLDATARLGGSTLSVLWQGWPAYFNEADGYQFTQQWLAILVQHARAQNVELALINSANNRHQLKYFREVFHRTPGLAFTYDIGNSNVGVPQSLTRDYLFALGDRLRLVHLSDNDGTTPQYLPLGAPSQGGIQLDHELRTLRTFRYDGDITLQVLGDRRWLAVTRDLLAEVWAQVT
ncbi:MAG: sugar phosphate isomerase/epimerase [Litorilinea sp.]